MTVAEYVTPRVCSSDSAPGSEAPVSAMRSLREASCCSAPASESRRSWKTACCAASGFITESRAVRSRSAMAPREVSSSVPFICCWSVKAEATPVLAASSTRA